MFKRILLPLDGSPLAEQALPVAVAQAEQFQAELVLLKVLEPLAEVYGMFGSPSQEGGEFDCLNGHWLSGERHRQDKKTPYTGAGGYGRGISTHPNLRFCRSQPDRPHRDVHASGILDLPDGSWVVSPIASLVAQTISVLLVPAAEKTGARSCVKKGNVSRV